VNEKLLVILRSHEARDRLRALVDPSREMLHEFSVVEGPGPNITLEGRAPAIALAEVRPVGAHTSTRLVGSRLESAEIYRVAERVLFDRPAPTRGWRRFGTHVRRSGTGRETFIQDWTIGHAALVRRHHPGVTRYAQDVVLSAAPGTPGLDGIYEADFPTRGSYLERLYDSPEGERLIEADNARFVESRKTERYFCVRD
jgi:hypothetical protein